MHRVTVATAVCLLSSLCTVAVCQQCVMPASGVLAAQCDKTRTLSGGMAGTRWAYNWRVQRCHRVALSCDDTVWTLFDTKRQCMDACGHSPPGDDLRAGWNPPASIYATTQHATPPPTTTKPHRICNTLVDLVILLDASGSIEWPRWGGCAGCFDSAVRNFSELMIGRRVECSGMDIKAMRFSVWRFGKLDRLNYPHGYCDVYHGFDGFDFKASEKLTNDEIIAKVRQIQFYDGGTNIHDALSCAHETLRNSPRRHKSEVKRIAVLITDGQADESEQARANAAALRADKTSVIAVGFGTRVQREELRSYTGVTGGRDSLLFDLQNSKPDKYLSQIVSVIQICYHCLSDYPDISTCDDQRCIDRFSEDQP